MRIKLGVVVFHLEKSGVKGWSVYFKKESDWIDLLKVGKGKGKKLTVKHDFTVKLTLFGGLVTKENIVLSSRVDVKFVNKSGYKWNFGKIQEYQWEFHFNYLGE